MNPLSFPTSAYTHPPEPPTYQHPSSSLGNGSNNNGFNINRSLYYDHDCPYQATSSSVLDDGHIVGESYVPGKSEYGIGCKDGRGTTSATEHAGNAGNGMPILRPPSQVHAHRHKQLPMMGMPMSVPSTDVTLLHTHGSKFENRD